MADPLARPLLSGVKAPETTIAVLELVADERARQREKWGAQHHCTVEWVTILAEEVGEAAKEALDIHFKPDVRNDPYVVELIQSAAVAVAAVENVLYGSA